MSTDAPSPSAPPAPVSTSAPARANPPYLLIAGGVVLIIILAVWGLPLLTTPAPASPDAPTLAGEPSLPATLDDPEQNLAALKSSLSKEKFLKLLYTVNRDTYNLYEKAAKYRNTTVEEVQEFFFNCCDLVNEKAIFADLPPLPSDFSQVAYDISSGNQYQIGLLDQRYYSQPEFYSFVDQETGIVNRVYAFQPWSKPELNQWGDNGMQAYPGDQWDEIHLSGRKEFTSVVFVTNAWNIQNFVGIQLVPDSEAVKNFDIHISEERTGQPYFLLGPTFPYFHHDWATKVTITGTPRPGTPPGVYSIGINPSAPPAEFSEKAGKDHPALYANYGFLRPTDNYITLHITVSP